MIKKITDIYECTPQELAAKIDYFAGLDITGDSVIADNISREKDWSVMADKYQEVLCSLL